MLFEEKYIHKTKLNNKNEDISKLFSGTKGITITPWKVDKQCLLIYSHVLRALFFLETTAFTHFCNITCFWKIDDESFKEELSLATSITQSSWKYIVRQFQNPET